MKTKLKLGIVGFGVVGQGLYKVLQNTKGLDVEVIKIAIKDPNKKRPSVACEFTNNVDNLIYDNNINTIVELIDNADDAYYIVKQAMLNGKNVVSANKKMIANHITELIQITKEKKVSFLYEASACGSIPVLRNLEEYYDNDLIQSVSGILNGSSNYILSKIYNENKNYNDVLKKAQELGFAESDPSSDVDGFDALYKLIIITVHSFGTIVNPKDVYNFGIGKISPFDITFAKEKGYKIKLIAEVEKIEEKISLSVMPRFVKNDQLVFNVENEVNGVVIKGLFYDEQFMLGKGAGDSPTGSAVLSDITALSHNYKYEYKKIKYYENFDFTNDIFVNLYIRYTNEADLNILDISDITESHNNSEYSYVIGKVNLKTLIKNRDKIAESNLFLIRYQ